MILDPKKIHEMEQSNQLLKEHFTPFLYSFFDGCVQQGFKRGEALQLTTVIMTIILSSPPANGTSLTKQDGDVWK